jgi:outer membrane lipoprotein-sorting protein
MKKTKWLLVIFVVLSVFMLAGCSGSNDADKTDESQTGSEKNATLDENLSGAALLSSLNFSYPDALKMTTTTSVTGSFDTTSTTYTKGENFRMEMEMPDVDKQITIYNATDKITYQYTEGQTTGFSFKDQETTTDLGDLNLDEGVTSIDDIADVFPENVVARVETLDGEKVIYIETSENDGQNGTIDTRMWFSTRYGVPLKTEILSNGTLTMSSMVTDISDGDIADSQFTPPSNVVFTDYSSMNLDDLTDIPSP